MLGLRYNPFKNTKRRTQPHTPTAQVETPAAPTERQTVQFEVPAVQIETLVPQTEPPVSQIESPVSKTEVPVSKTQPPVSIETRTTVIPTVMAPEATTKLAHTPSTKTANLSSSVGASGFSTPPTSPGSVSHSKFGANGFSAYGDSRSVSGHYGSSLNRSFAWTSRHGQSNEGYKIGFVQESAISLKKKSMSELGVGVSQSIANVSFINLIECIRDERLATLPHKGSRWDKVLIRAQYFAEKLHHFDKAIQGFALDSSAAAELGYGHARLLLELGHENSEALDKAFGFFYKNSLTIATLLERTELLSVTPETREELCKMYTDLLSLVVDVAIRFYKVVHGMLSSSVSLDMFEVFGDTIGTLRSRKNKVEEAIWSYQIEGEGLDPSEVLDVKAISRWLAPQDRVLGSLGRDHTTFADHQAELTCLWFQKHLSKFAQGDASYLLLTGQAGSGKTALAASIAERLQRPLGKKSFSSLFCSISSGIPSQADSISVAKSILIQLLNSRVGNMAMYYALAHAYELCSNTADDEAYENHVWHALAEVLKNPLEKSNDLIIIVDGLDEVNGGAAAAQVLFEKLLNATEQGKRVKLVALSQSKPVSASANHKGIEYEISRDDIHDDIYAVAIKSLMHNHYFHKKAGPEQEEFLNRVIQQSNGSFLWTVLVCELLNLEKSPESFGKTWETLEKTPPSVPDITLKLLGVLEPSNDAKTILSWLAAAERPFTLQEIEILFSIDVQKGTFSQKFVDIHTIIKSLKPILSIHDDIVRFRHPAIQRTLQTAIKQGKIPVPIKDYQTDLVLRTLIYTKSTLHEKREPEFDPTDQSLADRLFHKHHFLEYAIRYWVLHLQHAGLAPKPSGDFTVVNVVQKNLPESATAPILEKLCWDAQFPGAREVEYHALVGRLRSKVFTENHPVVLQTYLSCAVYYQVLSNTTETEKYYYLCTKISRAVLSDFHPLTAECANSYLRITETMTSTSRTEIMTHREEILIILISAYERQFGATSEIVIRTRTTLAELYMYIHEEERARVLYQIIQDATVQHYGKNSSEAHGVSEKLNVVLGKKDDQVLETYNDSLFGEDREDETVEEFTLGQISIILGRAEGYLSKQEFTLAERTYVELWQRVSSLCRTTRSIEWHAKNIDIALAYASFLRSQKRETECSAVLAAVWEQYEHHELSFSDSIMTQLIQVAEVLQSIGYYTYALSIFKHASFYYKSVRKEESHYYSKIEQQIAQTSTQIIQQTVTSSSTTTTVSESVFQDVFQSIISSSTEINSTTISLAKKLTLQYMEQRKWSEAITVIKSTLQRTWASFFSESSHDITITSTFLQESIALVEQLAECYIRQRQLEKVEDVYLRLFRAVLRSPQIDQTIFEKAKQQLLNFYDKHGYVDSAISVYQEILVVYRTTFGPSHEKTIQVLYILASRCRDHPRNHPYWIEYYQQIVTNLNKTEICHKDAMDAIIIVSSSYWEDRRFAEAVTVFGVLWATFTQKSKEYKQFSDTSFVQTLYERYTQCLEETRASWEVLYKVTKEYRETCIKSFSAESTITAEATLSLARVAQRSESHSSEAISLYEQISSSSTTTSISTVEINQTLSSLYVQQITSQSSSSVTSVSIERATSMQLEQYTEARSKYGYCHETSLSRLRELTSLYVKQKKVELAIKELSTAIVEINTKETSSQKLIESASSIAATYHAINLVERCSEIVEELHRQVIAKDARNASKFSFDLTKVTRSSLIFLATLEYHIRKDLSITFSEIFASIVTEAVLFEQFRKSLQAKEGMRKLLLVAAPLRYFLVQQRRQGLVTLVDEEVVELFVQKETSKLGLLSKDSPRIFIVAILEHLGHKHKDFNRAVIFASNERVAQLTNSKKFPEAQDVAHLGFLFAVNHKAYSGPNAISYGFKLASLLVGRDGEKCPDPALRKKMLQLSNRIVKKILEICKTNQINFAQVQLPELSKLSALLGEQQDYETLEWLLTTLWNTRDAQRSWPAEVLLQLGRRLICARYLAGHPVKAIRLCEDIAYNMRRVHGARHPATLDTYLLLSELYTSTGLSYQSKAASDKSSAALARDYFKKALLIHEDMLRLLVTEEGSGDDSDDELDSAAAILAEHGVSVKGSVAGPIGDGASVQEEPTLSEAEKAFLAKRHLVLLKLAYQRLGAWPKQVAEYERLNADAFRVFEASQEWKGLEGWEKWSVKGFGGGKAESEYGVFKESGVGSWEFVPGPGVVTTHTELKPVGNGTLKFSAERVDEEEL